MYSIITPKHSLMGVLMRYKSKQIYDYSTFNAIVNNKSQHLWFPRVFLSSTSQNTECDFYIICFVVCVRSAMRCAAESYWTIFNKNKPIQNSINQIKNTPLVVRASCLNWLRARARAWAVCRYLWGGRASLNSLWHSDDDVNGTHNGRARSTQRT